MDPGRDDDRSLLAMAEREERLLAQELHDTLCQSLTGLSLLAHTALRRRRAGREVDLAAVRRISEQLDLAVGQSRVFVASQILTTHPERLPELVQELMRGSAPGAVWNSAGAGDIEVKDPALARLLYRIVRETLAALRRQAPSRRLTVGFQREGPFHVLEIRAEAQKEGSFPKIVFDPDKILRRFARARRLTWQVSPSSSRDAILRCLWRPGPG